MSYKTEIKYKKRINLDSIFLSENVDKSNYVYNLTNPIKNVTKISLVDISYPNTGTYNITGKNNTLIFRQLLSDAEVTDITLLDNKKVVLNVEKKINWIDEKIAEKDRKDIWFLNNQFRPTNSDVGIVFDNVYKLTNSDVENKDSITFQTFDNDKNYYKSTLSGYYLLEDLNLIDNNYKDDDVVHIKKKIEDRTFFDVVSDIRPPNSPSNIKSLKLKYKNSSGIESNKSIDLTLLKNYNYTKKYIIESKNNSSEVFIGEEYYRFLNVGQGIIDIKFISDSNLEIYKPYIDDNFKSVGLTNVSSIVIDISSYMPYSINKSVLNKKNDDIGFVSYNEFAGGENMPPSKSLKNQTVTFWNMFKAGYTRTLYDNLFYGSGQLTLSSKLNNFELQSSFWDKNLEKDDTKDIDFNNYVPLLQLDWCIGQNSNSVIKNISGTNFNKDLFDKIEEKMFKKIIFEVVSGNITFIDKINRATNIIPTLTGLTKDLKTNNSDGDYIFGDTINITFNADNNAHELINTFKDTLNLDLPLIDEFDICGFKFNKKINNVEDFSGFFGIWNPNYWKPKKDIKKIFENEEFKKLRENFENISGQKIYLESLTKTIDIFQNRFNFINKYQKTNDTKDKVRKTVSGFKFFLNEWTKEDNVKMDLYAKLLTKNSDLQLTVYGVLKTSKLFLELNDKLLKPILESKSDDLEPPHFWNSIWKPSANIYTIIDNANTISGTIYNVKKGDDHIFNLKSNLRNLLDNIVSWEELEDLNAYNTNLWTLNKKYNFKTQLVECLNIIDIYSDISSHIIDISKNCNFFNDPTIKDKKFINSLSGYIFHISGQLSLNNYESSTNNLINTMYNVTYDNKNYIESDVFNDLSGMYFRLTKVNGVFNIYQIENYLTELKDLIKSSKISKNKVYIQSLRYVLNSLELVKIIKPLIDRLKFIVIDNNITVKELFLDSNKSLLDDILNSYTSFNKLHDSINTTLNYISRADNIFGSLYKKLQETINNSTSDTIKASKLINIITTQQLNMEGLFTQYLTYLGVLNVIDPKSLEKLLSSLKSVATKMKIRDIIDFIIDLVAFLQSLKNIFSGLRLTLQEWNDNFTIKLFHDMMETTLNPYKKLSNKLIDIIDQCGKNKHEMLKIRLISKIYKTYYDENYDEKTEKFIGKYDIYDIEKTTLIEDISGLNNNYDGFRAIKKYSEVVENYIDTTLTISGYSQIKLQNKYLIAISGFTDLYFKYPYDKNVYYDESDKYKIEKTGKSLKYSSKFPNTFIDGFNHLVDKKNLTKNYAGPEFVKINEGTIKIFSDSITKSCLQFRDICGFKKDLSSSILKFTENSKDTKFNISRTLWNVSGKHGYISIDNLVNDICGQLTQNFYIFGVQNFSNIFNGLI